MRAIVVDDEQLNVEHIERLLDHAGIEVAGRCTNPYEALGMAEARQPDVLFLDIEMPELSGLEIAERVYAAKLNVEIVFITAHNQYAIDAFRVNALDYLLKPVMEEDLQRSLERVAKRRHLHGAAAGTGGKRQVTVSLFGKLSVHIGDSPEPVRWVTSKCAELFAYMLLQPREKEVTKWELFEALWADKNAEKADINLRSTVSRINKTLRDRQAGMALSSVKNGYRLSLADNELKVDAHRLERFVVDSAEVDANNCERCEPLLSDCNQPLLQEFDGQWCEAYRTQYRQYYLRLGRRLLSYFECAETEPRRTLQLADMLVGHDPYDDFLRATALRLHYRTGGRKRAEAYFGEYAELLKTELGAKPSEEISALFQALVMTNTLP